MQKLIIFITLFFIFCTGFIAIDIYLEKPSSPIIPNITKNVKEPINLTEDEITLAKASEQFYNQHLLRTRFNGAILVAKSGKIVFERYNGLTEINIGEPIDSSIAFHLASISKTFTAMGILKLGQDNKLNIDDPVSKYVENFPYSDITIRNLLSHRSGLPNYVHFMESMG
ncbi:MAG: serine hydrolase, partial [Chitinophagaceae bacterium]